ncbi:MAG: DUF11 domain-containing protein, partial [Anaerolineae bacterium]|nr:DUF11 domain-containing protein [Anaerolineae bacterium]
MASRRLYVQLVALVFVFALSSFLFPSQVLAEGVTRTYSGPTVQADGNTRYIPITFSASDFPPNAVITKVTVTIRWTKTDGWCDRQRGGYAYHSETEFRLRSPDWTTVTLVRLGTYRGGRDIGTITTTFDDAASSYPAHCTPVSGTFKPNGGQLASFNGKSPVGTWYLLARDSVRWDPLCVYSYSITIETQERADLCLSKEDDPDPVPPGAVLTYTFTVRNAGPADAEGVVLTDDLPAALQSPQYSLDGGNTWANWTGSLSLGTVNRGGSRQVLIRGTVNPSATGTLENTASVSASTTDPNTGNNSASQTTTLAPSADLQLTKLDALDPIVPGAVLTYTLRVYNEGPTQALGVVLSDTLPAGLLNGEYSTDGGATWDSWPGTLALGNMASEASQELLIRGTVAPTATQALLNIAEVSSGTADPDMGNNRALQTTTLLQVYKNVIDLNGGSAEPGDDLCYEIVILNNGDQDITGAVFTDTIPENTSYVEGSISAPAGSNVVSTSPTVQITDITVPARGQVLIRYRVQIDDPLPEGVSEISNQGWFSYDADGDETNEASKRTDGDASTVGEQVTTIEVVAGPNFGRVMKEVELYEDGDDDRAVTPGDILRYEVRIPNEGNQDAEGVAFTDTLPAEVEYVSGSAWTDRGLITYEESGKRILWNGDIPAGEEAVLRFDVRVRAGVQVGEEIANQGEVWYDTDD